MTKRMTREEWEKFAKMIGGTFYGTGNKLVRIKWDAGDCYDYADFTENMARQIMKAIGER